MGWSIQCNNPDCKEYTWASNIVDLIDNHTDSQGWFVCGRCGASGFIKKSFDLQEPGETWKPYLRGAIRLGDPEETYQPFVFMVSYEPNGTVNDLWFSYYKDLRETGGRLKLGYGPGGPPVLGTEQILFLLKTLTKLGLIDKNKIIELVE
ncbi:MAG: hypothetical protein N2317_07395 [Syntrophales bacterium]|nr:hypothetical protein [Syntrophales bacterium]